MTENEQRKRPVRTAEIELPEPFEGWKATVRTNIPMGVYDTLVGGKSWEEKIKALQQTVLEWNFVDDTGALIPLEVSEMRRRLGFAEVKLMIRAIDQEIADFLMGLNTPA